MKISRSGPRLFILLICSTGISAAAADETRMFWSSPWDHKIQSARLDGSDVRDVITNANGPYGFDIDIAEGKIYWAANFVGAIKRANLDGTDVETLVTGMQNPLGVALDPLGDKMYFTNQHAGKVQRANLDGSGLEDLITGRKYTGNISIDQVNHRIYWNDTPDGLGWGVRRANLNGSSFQTVAPSLSPQDIEFDVANSKVFWADRGSRQVYKADMNGANKETLFFIDRNITGLALDLPGSKAYWTDDTNGVIGRTNFDGTNTQILVTGINSPFTLMIVSIPVPEPTGGVLAALGVASVAFVCLRNRSRIAR